MSTIRKLEMLLGLLSDLSPIGLAYSGGVDSTLLLFASKLTDGSPVAFTAVDQSLPEGDRKDAESMAKYLGVKIVFVKPRKNHGFFENSPLRCYHCKRATYSAILKKANKLGLRVIDGLNYDDLSDFRPGREAAKEMDVISPLALVGFGKGDVRRASKLLGIPIWNKPSSPCLASRVPYGKRIKKNDLLMIGRAEDVVRRLTGARVVRVRKHGSIARIQVGWDEMGKLFNKRKLKKITELLKGIGFRYVCIDAGGYRKGDGYGYGRRTQEI